MTKKLYRDVDNRVLGGVCAGVGRHINIDPVLIRLIFVFAFITFGTGILIYIILWAVIPKAITTAQKLEMNGFIIKSDNYLTTD